MRGILTIYESTGFYMNEMRIYNSFFLKIKPRRRKLRLDFCRSLERRVLGS